MSLASPRLHSLAATLAALPSMSLNPFAPALSPSRVCPSMSRLDSLTPASSPVRVIPSMSHRFPLAPFPACSVRSIETRSLPAVTHVLQPTSTSRFCPSDFFPCLGHSTLNKQLFTSFNTASHRKVSELSSNSPLAFSPFDDVVAAWALKKLSKRSIVCRPTA